MDSGNAYGFQAGGHPGPIRIRRGEGLTVLPCYLQVQAVGGPKKFATLLEATVQVLVSQTLPPGSGRRGPRGPTFSQDRISCRSFSYRAIHPKACTSKFQVKRTGL